MISPPSTPKAKKEKVTTQETRQSPILKKQIKKVDPPLDPEKSSDSPTDSEALKKAL